MTVRTDITVNQLLSPRILRVAAPSTEVTIQDLHDTCRALEDDFENMPYPSLISSAGKEELGGGVSVGLTSTLQNVRLAFDARKTAVASGAATSTDATGTFLTDTAATFVAAAVEPGAWVVNLTDGSVCSVVRVLSETQIETDMLGGGADNQWTATDTYKIWNVAQVEVSGGNLVAVDSAGVPIDAILPTAGTQVVRTSASSATLQEVLDIQYGAYSYGVSYDASSQYTGTAYPVGTLREPVNNLEDALAIATELGFATIYVLGSATINGGLNFQNFQIIGESVALSAINVSAAAQVTGCEFSRCTLTGTLDGAVTIRDAVIGTVSFANGLIQDCALAGTISLSGAQDARFVDCWDGMPGAGVPTLNVGSGADVSVRGYRGELALTNMTGADEVSVDIVGRLILDATVTTGTVVVRGIGRVTLGGATATVDQAELVSPLAIDTQLALTHGAGSWEGGGGLTAGAVADAVWDEAAADHVAAGSMGLLEGRLDAAITSRAAPGAAMTLTSGERTALDAALTAAHGAGTWQGGLSGAQAQMLLELYDLMGLDPLKPLIVTSTSRKVPANGSEIDQAITDAAGTVTVQRL
jgi:hypothetical protein